LYFVFQAVQERRREKQIQQSLADAVGEFTRTAMTGM